MSTNAFVALAFGPDGGPYTFVQTGSGLPVALPTGGTTVIGPVAAGSPPGSNAPVSIAGYDGTNLQRISTDTGGRSIMVGAATDASALAGAPVLMAGSDGANARTLRTPNVFKTAQVSASGNTTIWTPAGGKKFRLMRFIIVVPPNCTLAARAVEVITFNDSGSAIGLGVDVWLGQTAPVETASSQLANFTTGWVDLGNGYLSTAANNVLQLNLGTVLAAGNIRVTCCGTEE